LEDRLMSFAQEDLHHRLHQLQFLAAETTDPLAERLVHELILELEDELARTSPNYRLNEKPRLG
jgi:hypothetical protein